MKKITYILSLIPVVLSPAIGNVIVNTELPNQFGTFGVKITGEGTEEVIISIPQCIGGLGIKVEDGNKYTMKTSPECTVDVPYEPIKE